MPNVLVVDDQPHLQQLLSEEFMDEGYNIVGVSDAESVRGYLRNSKTDLVLLDLYLDGFQGWDLLRDIKSIQPDLPVLIVTAYDCYSGDIRLSQAEGYIVKSFSDFDKLKRKIAEIVGERAIFQPDINSGVLQAGVLGH